MILTIGNIKGGVGKSTLACNLAVAFAIDNSPQSILLVDGDKQGSSADFALGRAEHPALPQFTTIRAEGKELLTQVQNLKGKFEHIIIDAGGQDNPSLRAGLVISEMVMIPIVPRSFELWALDKMADLVEEASITNPNLKPNSVLNLAYARGQDNADTANILRDEYPQFPMISEAIVQRKAFSDSSASGLSVLDTPQKDPKAAEELKNLYEKLKEAR